MKHFKMFLLVTFLLITGYTSAGILSENHIERNGQTILQLMVSIDSGSMSPNLSNGDLVVVENRSDILPGDVILFRPYGKDISQCNTSEPEKAEPLVHRAIRWVKTGEPMWENGPRAPFAGYITKGDNNDVIDQNAGQIFGVANSSYVQECQNKTRNIGHNISIDKKTGLIIYTTDNGTFVGDGISYLVPVKKDWIIGIVRAKIPFGSDWTKLSERKEAHF
jgi:signal peptidase